MHFLPITFLRLEPIFFISTIPSILILRSALVYTPSYLFECTRKWYCRIFTSIVSCLWQDLLLFYLLHSLEILLNLLFCSYNLYLCQPWSPTSALNYGLSVIVLAIVWLSLKVVMVASLTPALSNSSNKFLKK